MGLSYAQEYSCRDHFRQRAFERFGVDEVSGIAICT